MMECSSKPTPTSLAVPLGSDKDGPPACRSWKCSSVVGMLLFLSGNSRPEKAFAVHQCARFMHNPKASHEEAVLRMCRHSQGAKTDGLILKPNPELGVDMFVDADFAGLCGHEDNSDPISARSRTGMIIALAGCPIDWVPKLQTMTATSTMESEMIALSHGM